MQRSLSSSVKWGIAWGGESCSWEELFTSLTMDHNGVRGDDFVPVASVIAFVFVGAFLIIGLIGRCLALNQSTLRSAQSLDLMIYRAPPKPIPTQKTIRPSTDQQYDANDSRDQRISFDDPVVPVPVQRGPKNLWICMLSACLICLSFEARVYLFNPRSPMKIKLFKMDLEYAMRSVHLLSTYDSRSIGRRRLNVGEIPRQTEHRSRDNRNV